MKCASSLLRSSIKRSIRQPITLHARCFSDILFDPYAPKHKEHALHVEALQAARRQSNDQSLNPSNSQTHQSINQPISHSNQSTNQSHSQSDSHSNDQSTNQSQEDDLRTQILDLALSKVPEYGWTVESLNQAIKQSNLSVGLIGLFQNGAYDMVIHHHNRSTHESIKQLMSLPLDEMSLNDRLTTGLINQLNNQSKFHSTLPQMIGLSILPTNLPTTLQLIADYVDQLWYICGDQSINQEYYLKRASIISIYSMSCLYLATDQSVSHQQTVDFLMRSMRDLDELRSATQTISQSLNQYSAMLMGMLQQAGNTRK